MTAEEYKASVKELMTVPGMSRDIADNLILLGIKTIENLRDKSAERLYHRYNRQSGLEDRTVLYILRCAVYYATNEFHKPEKLVWQNWKDKD